MTRAEMIALIYRLNDISNDPYMGEAAACLRLALAEGGQTFRVRIAKLAQANRHIGSLIVSGQNADHAFLLNAAEIALSEIGACAGEKRHDWSKLYPK